jgi:D-arabinose 1-dehydrogenase-like Zn-dependent alcohol dehydrogenase
MEITAAVLRAADGPSPAPPPIIGGHEGAGVVEAVGAGVSRVRVGDHVALSFDLIETFPLSAINDAEHSSLSGGVIKPVLLP